jgi:hypothetical protein
MTTKLRKVPEIIHDPDQPRGTIVCTGCVFHHDRTLLPKVGKRQRGRRLQRPCVDT